MPFGPIKLRILAERKEDENWDFRHFIKCNDVEDLDDRVAHLARRVWSGIDCTTCANCCKEVRPTFSQNDVDRLARRLGLQSQQLIDSYLEPTENGADNPWQTRSTPCPFLKDDRCTVYDDRPADCRGYPYLYEPNFEGRTMAMIKRTFICPIVYDVLEELKASVGFPRRKRRRR